MLHPGCNELQRLKLKWYVLVDHKGQMNWYVTTSICVTIILGKHVYIVKDYTVEVVNFHRLGKAGIHQNALVEAALVELFG